MKKSQVDKSMEAGATSLTNHPSRRFDDVAGNNLPDPFFDSYLEEMLACHDIIEVVNNELSENVNLIINKDFMRKIVKSHINFIKEMEKILAH